MRHPLNLLLLKVVKRVAYFIWYISLIVITLHRVHEIRKRMFFTKMHWFHLQKAILNHSSQKQLYKSNS